ncbi:DUF6299 family protein [Streptomyces sp. NPDC056437]|uniref:DUF6299 family protein n=1 Tax=Streptomyces sp. NPDC056437 TaxID=3345816 RepID=UPI00368E2619
MITARRATLISSVCIAAALATGLTPGSASAQFAPDTVTVDGIGLIAEDGTLTLSGTYRCSSLRTSPIVISSKATQGNTQVGIGSTTAICDGQEREWRNTGNHMGLLAPGAAQGEASLIALDTSRGFIPIPVVLTTQRGDLTLQQG